MTQHKRQSSGTIKANIKGTSKFKVKFFHENYIVVMKIKDNLMFHYVYPCHCTCVKIVQNFQAVTIYIYMKMYIYIYKIWSKTWSFFKLCLNQQRLHISTAVSLCQEDRNGSKWTEKLTGQQIGFYTLVLCSASPKNFSLLFTSSQTHMCYAKLLSCKPFPEIFEAKIQCKNLLFPERKETLFEEETQQTEQTFVGPEVRLLNE